MVGDSIVFNCHIEFPEAHPVPYVIQWEKKVYFYYLISFIFPYPLLRNTNMGWALIAYIGSVFLYNN